MQAVASAAPTPNPWSLNPDTAYEHMKVLSPDMQSAACVQILNQLSDYLEPFGRITSHPLLLSVTFFEHVNQISSLSSLIDQKLFKGCFLVATALVDEPGLSEEPLPGTDYLDPKMVKGETIVLAILESYFKNKTNLEPTKKIFTQVNSYLAPISPIFACTCFEKEEFYVNVFSLINKVQTKSDLDLLSRRVQKLCYARAPAGYASRSSSRTSSAPATPGKNTTDAALMSDIARAVQRYADESTTPPASPRSVVLVPGMDDIPIGTASSVSSQSEGDASAAVNGSKPPQNDERRPLLSSKSEEEASRCCALV
jgi:hypothetical protein